MILRRSATRSLTFIGEAHMIRVSLPAAGMELPTSCSTIILQVTSPAFIMESQITQSYCNQQVLHSTGVVAVQCWMTCPHVTVDASGSQHHRGVAGHSAAVGGPAQASGAVGALAPS